MYMFGRRGNVGATLIRDRRRLDGSYVDEPSHIQRFYNTAISYYIALYIIYGLHYNTKLLSNCIRLLPKLKVFNNPCSI